MKTRIQIVFSLILIFCLAVRLSGQAVDNSREGRSELTSVAAIEDSVRQQFNRVQDYMVIVQVSVQMPGLRMPRKRIDLAFKQPDMVKVETTGFAVVPRTGMTMSPDEVFDNLSEPTVTGTESLDNRAYYILQSPVQADSFFIAGGGRGPGNISGASVQVWVDAGRWLISRVNVSANESELVNIVVTYSEIEPGIWLPEQTEFHFDLSSIASGNLSPPETMGGMDNSGEMLSEINPDSLEGYVKMEFNNYRVNTGLSDRFFEQSD